MIGNLLFLLGTVFCVSFDAFVCGISFALKREERTFSPALSCLFATLPVGALCFASALFASRLFQESSKKVVLLGGALLCLIGAAGFLRMCFAKAKERRRAQSAENCPECTKKSQENAEKCDTCCKKSFSSPKNARRNKALFLLFTGLAVGTDGAAAAFSLTAMGHPPLFTAFAITLCHYILFRAGLAARNAPFFRKMAERSFFSFLLLFLIGAARIATNLF